MVRAFAAGSGNTISTVSDFPEIAVCIARFRRTDYEAINFDKSWGVVLGEGVGRLRDWTGNAAPCHEA
jgi:hypothetical protein